MSCGFSLEHYRELLAAAERGGYRFAHFDGAPEPGSLYLRHDVDLDLEAALHMSALERELGIGSTYFLMTTSVFYNLASPEGRRARRCCRCSIASTSAGSSSWRQTESTFRETGHRARLGVRRAGHGRAAPGPARERRARGTARRHRHGRARGRQASVRHLPPRA